jgi:EAL domain-containing protein (putative c-di-GMP-specific phosphodiesterase class I)/GGDEF domain-containing protein
MFSMDFRVGSLNTADGRAVIERLNGGIATLTDTQLQAIVLDHTSRRLYRYSLSDYLYEYGLVLVLAALLFVSLAVIMIQKQRTARLEQEEKMRRLIDHDPLTGALSLYGFRKRVEELLNAHPDVPYLICYSNIKNFKYINDSMGRAAGDELLCFWVEKARAVLSDLEAVARVEADHLALFRLVEGDEKIRQDEKDVMEPVRNFFIDRGTETRVQLCSGVYVLTPEEYQNIDVDRMLDYARVAEKRLRENHRDGFDFYNPEQWEKGKQVADIIGRLPAAIASGEFQIYYQPQVNFDTGKITGVEALCRWNHSKLGWLRPTEYIPTLEEYDLIYELDRYVWERVCQDLQRWNKQGKHRSVSVNLSRRDIREERNIPRYFYDLTRKYGLSVDQLRIEITESAYVEDNALLIGTTVKLREFGFQVEMDDFGSGYSSLHMLKEVPVDRIKMDLHFMTQTGDPEKGRIIVSYMIKMVNSLGMSLIAEGVESVTQARFLQNRGCSEMQGFYFHRPMPAHEFERICERLEEAPPEPRA